MRCSILCLTYPAPSRAGVGTWENVLARGIRIWSKNFARGWGVGQLLLKKLPNYAILVRGGIRPKILDRGYPIPTPARVHNIQVRREDFYLCLICGWYHKIDSILFYFF